MANNDEVPKILLYTRIRRSPFFYASRRHGVKLYSVYNRMYHPRHYGDPFEEFRKLITDVTLWDVGVERQVEITGPDAFAFTNLLTPRDLSKCAVGQCFYTPTIAQDGGIINDPVLYRLGENHFSLSVADSDVLLWVKGVAVYAGMNVHIQEPDVGLVQVQGPKSRQVMRDLFGDRVMSLPYYYLFEAKLDDMDVVVSRTGYSNELGYEICLRNSSRDGIRLWERVLEAGRPHDIAVIGPCHIRRIEAGILAYGADMTLEDNPYEVGMGWAVDLEKEGDFIGKEALKRIKEEGVKRKLVGVEISGDSVGAYNDGSMVDFWPVRRGDTQIGRVTSACYSPRLEKNIGYAMVPIEYAELGTEFTVDTAFGERAARVVPKPFFDPKKEIAKA
ncbi:MAG: glycine cleavage T C-terminal barrel domain-containing protein [Dehalococcoidia bacterium]